MGANYIPLYLRDPRYKNLKVNIGKGSNLTNASGDFYNSLISAKLVAGVKISA